MKNVSVIVIGLVLSAQAFGSADAYHSTSRLTSANANILTSLVHGQKFAKCAASESKDGEPAEKITCVVKDLSCSASSEGYGLGAGFEIVKNAGCYSKTLKKNLSKDLATGIIAVLRAANIGDTGPDGYYTDDKLRRDSYITEIKCVSYFETPANNSCELTFLHAN